MVKEKESGDARGLADVELYFTQIKSLLKVYACVAAAGGRGRAPSQ